MKARIYISLVVCLLAFSGYAQKTAVLNAGKALKAGNLDEALTLINGAIEHDETKGLSYTWYYAGFIYKEAYNQTDKQNKSSEKREKAITYFSKFLEIETDKSNQLMPSTLKSLRYLSSTIYNDAVNSLNVNEYEQAIAMFDKFKKTMVIVDEAHDFKDLEVQFHLVLGTVYTQIYNKDKKVNQAYFTKIKNSYNYVLELDPKNIGANYNLGILYYNEGVNRIKALDYDFDLTTIDLIQQECVEMFQASLPYMQKAYETNPNRKETLIGLSGIYFSLNELERSEEIQKELLRLEGDGGNN